MKVPTIPPGSPAGPGQPGTHLTHGAHPHVVPRHPRLDPLADRLYILATLLALVARDGLPLWWALTLIGRDVVLSACLPVLRRAGHGPLPGHFLGKAATFNLLYAFPMLLAALPSNEGWLATVFRPMGWAFATWGSALYLWAGVLYVVQVRQVLRADRAADEASGPTGGAGG